MTATRLRLAATLLALMLPNSSLNADPPKSTKAPRLDLYGDPLPEGAIARMGTTRFRHDATSVAYLDAKTLVTAGDGVRFWDVATGKMIREWKAEHFGSDRIAALSGNGRILISVTQQSSLRAWDTTTGKLLAERQKNATERRGDAIVCLVVSRDGKRFASVREVEHVAWVWGLEQEKELCKIELPPGREASLIEFSASGRLVGIRTVSRIEVRNADSGKLAWRCEPGVGDIYRLAFSPDESKIAILGRSDIALFELSGKLIWKVKHDGVPLDTRFFPDGHALAVSCFDDESFRSVTVQKLDVSRGRSRRLFAIPLQSMFVDSTMSPDSKVLATVGDGRIDLWNLADGKEINKSLGHPNAVRTTCITPDGRFVASGDCNDQVIRLWDNSTGKEVRRFRGHEGGIIAVVVSPDGKLLASSSTDWTVRVWDIATAREVARLGAFPQPIWHLRFLVDSSTLAVASCEHAEFSLYDVKSKAKTLERLAGEKSTLAALIRAPNGQVLAVSSVLIRKGKIPSHTLVSVRDPVVDRRIQEVACPPTKLTQVALSADGRTIVLGLGDGTFHLFELETGQTRVVMRSRHYLDNQAGVQFFALSPDGLTIASAGRHAPMIDLWNVATGKLMFSFEAPTAPINTVEYTPDGKILVTGSQDSTLMSWDMTLPNRHAVLPAVTLSAGARAKHWASLAGPAEPAFRSIWAFAADRNDAVKFFKGKFATVERVPMERIKKWIADLDSPQFAVREKAERSLIANVGQTELELRRALKNGLGAEGHKRAQRILEVPASAKLSPDQLREIRAIEALEKIGTPEARELLRSLTRGNYRPRTIREAELTLRRIESRSHKQEK